MTGANRTGRPFTGDFAGDLLYATLSRFGFANGHFAADPGDGLELIDCLITNAVRCVPPQNKPTPGRDRRPAGRSWRAASPRCRTCARWCAWGGSPTRRCCARSGARLAAFPFAHGARHDLGGYAIFDSYHCSRYNTNTRRLTPEMFEAVFAAVRAEVPDASGTARAAR